MKTSSPVNISAVLRVLLVGFVAILAWQGAAAQHLPVKREVRQATATDTIAAAPDSVRVVLGEAEIGAAAVDSILAAEMPKPESPYDRWEPRTMEFNPDPTRAVWMSALFPGLGQIYNRRYWKLPIVIGGYLGLSYATNWNNGMLKDYTRAYRDIMDNDPSTNSYMNFFPPTTTEDSLDKTWLTNVLQSRKNYYRRNRDLCIICMVGVYFIAMIDAYVDASLSHFDISPELAVDVAPTIFRESHNDKPALGLTWALTF